MADPEPATKRRKWSVKGTEAQQDNWAELLEDARNVHPQAPKLIDYIMDKMNQYEGISDWIEQEYSSTPEILITRARMLHEKFPADINVQYQKNKNKNTNTIKNKKHQCSVSAQSPSRRLTSNWCGENTTLDDVS